MANTVKQVGKVRHTLKGTWDEAASYEMMDVVTDPENGEAYESLKDVPAGPLLSDPTYWMKLLSISPLQITETELHSLFEQLEW